MPSRGEVCAVGSWPKALTLVLSSEVSWRSLRLGECPTDGQEGLWGLGIVMRPDLARPLTIWGSGAHILNVCTCPNMSSLCPKDPS